ncbi:MAG TPA: hypothetical protein VNB67_10020, partial [Nitrososphaeraceae archaeon]|nr:hypothetical protein [Nitrososphaeraceae archaeon]
PTCFYPSCFPKIQAFLQQCINSYLISLLSKSEDVCFILLFITGFEVQGNKIFNILITLLIDRYNRRLLNPRTVCPICKTKIVEHSEFQDKICRMITIKQFANNSPGFDVAFRPFFEDDI